MNGFLFTVMDIAFDGDEKSVRFSLTIGVCKQDNVQEQAQGFVESIKSGATRASEQVQAAGKDIMSRADHVLGRSTDDDEEDSKVLKLKPEDFEEGYIEIDDGSAKESILL